MNADATSQSRQFKNEIRDGLSPIDQEYVNAPAYSYAPYIPEDTYVPYNPNAYVCSCANDIPVYANELNVSEPAYETEASTCPCANEVVDASIPNQDDYYEAVNQEVFYDDVAYKDIEYDTFVPTSMYLRIGGGMNLAMATTKARVADEKFKSKNSWNVLLGLGWNLSPYVRTEIEFQDSEFKFKDLKDASATYHMLNGMFYFDFIRRYVQDGGMAYRRTFVPFLGIGAGIGEYDFSGSNGSDGLVIAAPRAELGFNLMITELIGIDIAYQYQMMIDKGFGWNTKRTGVDHISNVMATFRVNF